MKKVPAMDIVRHRQTLNEKKTQFDADAEQDNIGGRAKFCLPGDDVKSCFDRTCIGFIPPGMIMAHTTDAGCCSICTLKQWARP